MELHFGGIDACERPSAYTEPYIRIADPYKRHVWCKAYRHLVCPKILKQRISVEISFPVNMTHPVSDLRREA